jgi:hypothetical protein
LLEETGCIADMLIPLGNQVMRAGVSNGKIHIFLALCKERRSAEPEPTELIEVKTSLLSDFTNQIVNGAFEQLLGLACWYKRQKYLEK